VATTRRTKSDELIKVPAPAGARAKASLTKTPKRFTVVEEPMFGPEMAVRCIQAGVSRRSLTH